jgi:hypothetical protein
MYDMTKQWVLDSGAFEVSYRWLTTTIPEEVFGAATKEIFKKQFGVNADDFQIVR